MKTWLILGAVYICFFFWYTDVGGKLDEEEIEFFLERLEENASINAVDSSSQVSLIKSFMEEDTGRQFFMVNNVDMDGDPEDVEGAEPGESAESLLDRYLSLIHI